MDIEIRPVRLYKVLSYTPNTERVWGGICTVDLPREDKPDMPPAGEIQVYVIVTEGATPVFTKVIR